MKSLALILAAVVAGCAPQGDQPRLKTRAERQQAAQDAVDRGPQTRRYSMDAGQLLVLDVPVISLGMPEMQRCFVWRDTEFRSATLSCAQQPEIVVTPN